MTNFSDDAEKIRQNIEEKNKEKETEITISSFIQQHLKEQADNTKKVQVAWEKKKTDKETVAVNKKNDLKTRIGKKEDQIADYKEQ